MYKTLTKFFFFFFLGSFSVYIELKCVHVNVLTTFRLKLVFLLFVEFVNFEYYVKITKNTQMDIRILIM